MSNTSPDEGDDLCAPERCAFYAAVDDDDRRRWELLKPDTDFSPLLPAYLSRAVIPAWVRALARVLRPKELPPTPPDRGRSAITLILRCLWGVVAEIPSDANDTRLFNARTMAPVIGLLADVPRDPEGYQDWFSRHVRALCAVSSADGLPPRIETYLATIRGFSMILGQDAIRRERVLYGIEGLSFSGLDPSALQGSSRYGLRNSPPIVTIPTPNGDQTVYVESTELPNTTVYARVATIRGQTINWVIAQPPFPLVQALDLLVKPVQTATLTGAANRGLMEQTPDLARMSKIIAGEDLVEDQVVSVPELDEVEEALLSGKAETKNPQNPNPSAAELVDALPPYQRGRLRGLRVFLDMKPADVARMIAGTHTSALSEDTMAGMIALWEREARTRVTHVEVLAFARALKIDADTLDSWLDGTLPTADIATQIRNVDISAK